MALVASHRASNGATMNKINRFQGDLLGFKTIDVEEAICVRHWNEPLLRRVGMETCNIPATLDRAEIGPCRSQKGNMLKLKTYFKYLPHSLRQDNPLPFGRFENFEFSKWMTSPRQASRSGVSSLYVRVRNVAPTFRLYDLCVYDRCLDRIRIDVLW